MLFWKMNGSSESTRIPFLLLAAVLADRQADGLSCLATFDTLQRAFTRLIPMLTI
jgi:hypothetical protein